MPSSIRPAFATLWNLDLAFADVISTTTEPALGAIRLAWWRERLEDLDSGAVPAEPRLSAIARQLIGRDVSGKELSQLEDAWLPLLEPFPWGDSVAAGLELRGRVLFAIGARLLGGRPEDVEAPGALWSLVDGAHHCTDQRSRTCLLDHARAIELPRKPAAAVRPLTVLAALAAADLLDRTGTVARGLAALQHRATGGFPRRS